MESSPSGAVDFSAITTGTPIPAAQAARRAQIQAAGFASIPDAVRRTAHLSRNAAADVVGVGRTTITRWRARYPEVNP